MDGGAVYINERVGELANSSSDLTSNANIRLIENPSDGRILIRNNDEIKFVGAKVIITIEGRRIHSQPIQIGNAISLNLKNLPKNL